MYLFGIEMLLWEDNMKNILNTMFYILKFILFFVALGLSFYIILGMYNRLEKDYIGCINLVIPYILVIIIFCVNLFKNQQVVTKNIFYNITCVLVFSTITVVCLRAIFDKNMLLNGIMGYNINFSYFSDFLVFMKIMLYGLFLGNIFLILSGIEIREKKQEEEEIEVL